MSGWVRPAASKSLALGDGRAGAARSAGRIASEIWSATAAPVQHAAAVAFTEPPELAERIARSRSLHAAVCRAVAARFPPPGWMSGHRRPPSTCTPASGPGAVRWLRDTA